MKCPRDGTILRHSSPTKQLGIRSSHGSLVFICDACQGVWVENPQIASLKTTVTEAQAVQRVRCPSCQAMVGGLVEADIDQPGLMVCPHCAAILKYENLHLLRRAL